MSRVENGAAAPAMGECKRRYDKRAGRTQDVEKSVNDGSGAALDVSHAAHRAVDKQYAGRRQSERVQGCGNSLSRQFVFHKGPASAQLDRVEVFPLYPTELFLSIEDCRPASSFKVCYMMRRSGNCAQKPLYPASKLLIGVHPELLSKATSQEAEVNVSGEG